MVIPDFLKCGPVSRMFSVNSSRLMERSMSFLLKILFQQFDVKDSCLTSENAKVFHVKFLQNKIELSFHTAYLMSYRLTVTSVWAWEGLNQSNMPYS